MHFNVISCLQESIGKHFLSILDGCRQAFPRLYYVTDDDITSMLSVIRSPQQFLPTARKVFPGVELIRYKLPEDFLHSANHDLDYQLNGMARCT